MSGIGRIAEHDHHGYILFDLAGAVGFGGDKTGEVFLCIVLRFFKCVGQKNVQAFVGTEVISCLFQEQP